MASPTSLDNSSTVSFSDDENRQIDTYAAKIDIFDSKFILNYAGTLQKQIAKLPDLLLVELKEDSSSELNEFISSLLSELASFTPANSILKALSENRESLIRLRDEYPKISSKVSILSSLLEEKQLIFMQNLSTLKRMYEKGFVCYKKLCMFIESGKRRLEFIRKTVLPKYMNDSLTFRESCQKNILVSAISRFENRLTELEKTKILAVMFITQVDSYMQNNSLSLKQIKEIDDITIPNWKKKVKLFVKISDMFELVASTSNADISEFISGSKDLSNSISSLGETLTKNTESKKGFDELYLLGKEIQESLQQ